jgi:hypothetical protein
MGLPQKSVYTKMYAKQYTKNVLLIQFVHWVLQVREFCQTYQLFARPAFFFRNFLIFHFQYSMIKGTIGRPTIYRGSITNKNEVKVKLQVGGWHEHFKMNVLSSTCMDNQSFMVTEK